MELFCWSPLNKRTMKFVVSFKKSLRKGQRSDEEPPWNSFRKWPVDCVQCCCSIEIQQAAEMTHSLKGSFTHPGELDIITIIPERKHFQWNCAIKKLRSHVNCFLYSANKRKIWCHILLVSLLPVRHWLKVRAQSWSKNRHTQFQRYFLKIPSVVLGWGLFQPLISMCS